MRTIHAAILVACAAGLVLAAPAANAAKAFGGHPSHGPHASGTGLSKSFPHVRPFGGFSRWPLYGFSPWRGYSSVYGGYYAGGYIATAPSESDAWPYVMPERVIYVAVPPQALSCKRSVDKITVPSSLGGTREITVTRC